MRGADRAGRRAAEPGLVPPPPAARRRARARASQLGGRPRQLLRHRSRAVRRAAPGEPAAPCIPACGSCRHRRRDSRHRPFPSAPAGPVPVHREQRTLPDRRGAARAHVGRCDRSRSGGSHPKPLHPNAVRVDAEARHRHQRQPNQAPRRVRRAALRRRDHAVRPGPRGLSRVPVASAARALEHPRPRARGRDRTAPRYPAFERTAAELETRIGFLLPDPRTTTTRRSTHAER